MYAWTWSKELNFPYLMPELDIPDGTRHTPRPVYYEELDHYGVYEHYDYPRTEEPLMWAVNTRYIWRGETAFTLKDNGTRIEYKIDKLQLTPIDMNAFKRYNQDVVRLLTDDAINYIVKAIERFPKAFRVATYSGGKDSDVLLHILKQVTDMTGYDFDIFFADTTIELKPTYQHVQETYLTYNDDNFRIHIAKPYKTLYDLWQVAGPPSRNARWCCYVAKSSATSRLIREMRNGRFVIMFEGVRKVESVKRSKFEKETMSYKHAATMHFRPLFDWLTLEIYVYMMVNDMPFNVAYRNGLSRVGCGFCPFSPPRENLLKASMFEQHDDFVGLLEKFATKLFDKEEHRKMYVLGDWRGRKGGNPVTPPEALFYAKDKKQIDGVLVNASTNVFEWLKVIDPDLYEVKEFKAAGNKQEIIVEADKKTIGQVEKVLWKATHCTHCGACESHCPTGALTVFPEVHVDSDVCIHCNQCLDFYQRGCVIAASLGYTGKPNVKNTTASAWAKYGTFIPTKNAIEQVVHDPDWKIHFDAGESINHVYFVRWLYDMGIIDANMQFTKLAEYIKQFGLNEEARTQIVANLLEHSKLLRWLLQHQYKGNPEALKELEEILDYGVYEQVIKAIYAFVDSELYQWLLEENVDELQTNDNIEGVNE